MMKDLPLLDYGVIIAYLGAVAWLGYYCSKKNVSTEDYFLGGRSLPGWAIGLSMIGTSISSISFLAIPAAAYILDWRLLTKHLLVPSGLIFAFFIFIPLFRSWSGTTVFEYLEKRFGPAVRTYAAVCFVVVQLIRVGSILFLVSLPVSLFLDIPVLWAIYVGGAFILLYTVAGGIEAVVWTDVIQTGIFVLGGILSLTFIIFGLPDGFSTVFSFGSEFNKFNLGEPVFNLEERTLYTMLLAGITGGIGHFCTSQESVQRYLTCKSLKQARIAAAVGAFSMVPIWSFFFFIGTALWVFYQINPDPALATLEADQVFPFFILSQLPAGISGLIVAAVVAAAMSSLDSNLNSISTVVTVDIVKRFLAKDREDAYYLKIAKTITIVAGGFMMFGAHIFMVIPKESMADLNIIIPAVFGGAPLGLFLAGVFFSRLQTKPVVYALVVTVGLNLYYAMQHLGVLPESLHIPIHPYLGGILINGFFVVAALVLNRFFKDKSQDVVSPYSYKAFRSGTGASPSQPLENQTVAQVSAKERDVLNV